MASVPVILNTERTESGNLLLYEGFRYQKNRTSSKATFWRCWVKSCRAGAKTSAGLTYYANYYCVFNSYLSAMSKVCVTDIGLSTRLRVDIPRVDI